MGLIDGLKGAIGRDWNGSFITDPSKDVLPTQMDQVPTILGRMGVELRDPGVPLLDYTTGLPLVDAMWRSQPAVRTVTDFIATKVASTPLHVWRRVSDVDRVRVSGTSLATAVEDPDGSPWPTSAFRFWWRIVLDGLLTDRFLILVDPVSGHLTRVPPGRFRLAEDGASRVSTVQVLTGGPNADQWVDLEPGSALLDWGYAPSGNLAAPPLAALSQTLADQVEATRWRRQLWQARALMSGIVKRPSGATWTAENRERFLNGLRQFTGANGNRAGSTMLLEDGMEWQEIAMPKVTDTGDLAGRQLALVEVCNAYHVAPELVGVREGTYANVQAYRDMLYGDSLGPYYQALEDTLARLPGILGSDPRDYAEFHIQAKLRGSFADEAAILQTSVGGPWLTRNEARARQNLPSVEGGDDLITPLNVIAGGQASATDSGSQNVGVPNEQRAAATPRAKAAARTARVKSDQDAMAQRKKSTAQTLERTFTRQGKAIQSRLGAKAAAGEPLTKDAGDDGETPDWWSDAWDDELEADLGDEFSETVALAAGSTMRRLGADAGKWSADGVKSWLAASARGWAVATGAATISAVLDRLANAEDPFAAVKDFFSSESVADRADELADGMTTDVANFGAQDGTSVAAYQSGGQATKTWIVMSDNPRPSCAQVDGETVGLDDQFSNGLAWPGDSAGSADETCGCTCDMEMNVEGN